MHLCVNLADDERLWRDRWWPSRFPALSNFDQRVGWHLGMVSTGEQLNQLIIRHLHVCRMCGLLLVLASSQISQHIVQAGLINTSLTTHNGSEVLQVLLM